MSISAWDVVMVWLLWYVVLPGIGIASLVVLLVLISWWADRSKGPTK